MEKFSHKATSLLPRRAFCSLALVAAVIAVMFLPSESGQTSSQVRAPLDLVSDFPPDVNGFDLNPKWAWQAGNTTLPNPNELCFKGGSFGGCTNDKVYFDEPGVPNIATCAFGDTPMKGHVNWRPATYIGQISFGEFSADGDYCFEMVPPTNNGLTANRPTMHVEFSARETIKHFNTPWWKEFRDIVGWRVGGTSQAEREFLKDRTAIVIGLVNLDCVHSCYTELHPVYAMAVNVKSHQSSDGTIEEVWAIFARNWGNQGWCSQKQHYVNLETNSNRLGLVLPWGPVHNGSRDVVWSYELMNATKFMSNNKQATGPEISLAGSQGILVNFTLPKARDKARIHGELHLRWRSSGAAIAGAPGTSQTASPTSVVPLQDGEREERLLYEALGEEGRKNAATDNRPEDLDQIRQRPTMRTQPQRPSLLWRIFDPVKRVETLIRTPAPPVQPPTMEAEFDQDKSNRDKQLVDSAQKKP